jgi:osmotically inducible protein OsmC
MAAERTASVSWTGSLMEGAGTIESTGSGTLANLPVTWASRSEPSESGRTSPEELIAAAHASCFSMALSHALAQQGSAPERLDVKATSTFVPGTGITQMRLDLRGRVPGVDEAQFKQAAAEAKENCPVSKALAGNVDIQLDAKLEQ